MNAIRSANNHARMLWTAVALAVFTALSYVLIAFHVLDVGDLGLEQDGDAIY